MPLAAHAEQATRLGRSCFVGALISVLPCPRQTQHSRVSRQPTHAAGLTTSRTAAPRGLEVIAPRASAFGDLDHMTNPSSFWPVISYPARMITGATSTTNTHMTIASRPVGRGTEGPRKE